ncbi:MAG: hypothetical protein KA105_07870 [Caulobacter sp.]|nr:hypothetical protein [Caulobacter sp.]
MKTPILAAAATAGAAALAMAPAAPQAQGRPTLTYEAAIRCAAAYSGEAVRASGDRQRELVEWTGLSLRRADDLARARGMAPAQVYDDFGKAGIALRREPMSTVHELQGRCLLTAAMPIKPPVTGAAAPTCKAVKAILAAGAEPTAFRSISAPAKGGFTAGKLIPPGLKSCSVYPSIGTYSCAVLDLPPAVGWDRFHKLRDEVESCVGKPVLYDIMRGGKGGIARLGPGAKPRVSVAVTELDGKAMVSLTVEAE